MRSCRVTGVATAPGGGSAAQGRRLATPTEVLGHLEFPAQVWLVRFDVDGATLSDAAECLTPAERDRSRRGTPEVHRRRVLLRAALREVVGGRLGVLPHAVPLRVTATGRPELDGPARLDLSCSASGGIGLVAVADRAHVGVDVERVWPWSADVLDEGWLSPEERAAIRALYPAARAEAVSRSWTQKEAVLKGRGTGLAGGPADVPTPVGRAAGRIGGWDTCAVAVPAGHVATVATTPWPVGHDGHPADLAEPAPSERTRP